MTGRARLLAAASLSLLLGACASGPGLRPAAPAAATGPSQTIQAEEIGAAETPPAPEAPAEASPPSAPPDLWGRIARGLAFADCDDDDVAQRMRAYAANPEAFRLLLKRTLPSLEYVQAEVARRGLPSEFALLPMVESEFRAVQPRKGGVAGVWQLMPATAREHGLRIDREYDGRLDLAASTDTALALLLALRDQFPQDWRLVDMAYNAGHYRVATALAARERRGLESEPERLALPATTHAHVTKLEALACLVTDAAAHGIDLPQVDAGATLVAVPAAPGLDFELAARLSGTDMGRLRELNPAYLKGRIPRSGAHVLVLPKASSELLARTLEQIPAAVQATFGYTRLQDATEWQALAARVRVPRELLAALNGAAPDQRIPAGTRLYLPAGAAPAERAR